MREDVTERLPGAPSHSRRKASALAWAAGVHPLRLISDSNSLRFTSHLPTCWLAPLSCLRAVLSALRMH